MRTRKERGRHGKAFEKLLRKFMKEHDLTGGSLAKEIREKDPKHALTPETIQRFLNGTQGMMCTTKDAIIRHMERYGYEVPDVNGKIK